MSTHDQGFVMLAKLRRQKEPRETCMKYNFTAWFQLKKSLSDLTTHAISYLKNHVWGRKLEFTNLQSNHQSTQKIQFVPNS